MKNTRRTYEEELKSRLWNYTEDPGPDMWEGISVRLAKPGSDPFWVEWPNVVSGIVLVSLGFLSYQTQVGIDSKEPTPIQRESQVPANTPAVISISEPGLSHAPTQSRHSGLRPASLSNSSNPVTVIPLATEPIHAPNSVIAEGSLEAPPPGEVASAAPIFAATSPSSDSSRIEPEVAAKKVAAKRDTVVVVPLKKQDDRPGQRRMLYTAYLTITPMLGYQRVEFNQGDNILVTQYDAKPVHSSDRFGFHLAAGLELPLSKKFTMNGGLTYVQRNLSFTYTEKVLDSTSLTTGPGGAIVVTPYFSYPKREFHYEFRSLGLQVGVLYKLSSDKPKPLTVADALSSGSMMPKKRFAHFVGAGLEWQWLLNRTSATTDAHGFESPSGYSFVNLYYRVQYPSKGRWKALLQPTFNYAFYSNQTTNGLVRIKPYAFGVSMGCTYTF